MSFKFSKNSDDDPSVMYYPSGGTVTDLSSIYCGQPLQFCAIDGTTQTDCCYVFDKSLQEFVKVDPMTKTGVPFVKEDKCVRKRVRFTVCGDGVENAGSGTDGAMTLADLQALPQAAGSFNTTPALPIDYANAEHTVFNASAEGIYVNTEIKKDPANPDDDFLVENDDSCVVEPVGSPATNLNQGAVVLLGDDGANDPTAAIGDDWEVKVADGSAVEFCFDVAFCGDLPTEG